MTDKSIKSIVGMLGFFTWVGIIICLCLAFPNNTPWEFWVVSLLVLVYGGFNHLEGYLKGLSDV